MKTIYLLLLSFTICYGTLAQVAPATDVKIKTVKEDLPGYSLKYAVVKADPKLKHGPYVLEGRSWKTEGQYDMGKASGVWSFYSWGNKLEYKFDFDSNTEVFSDKKNDSLNYEIKVFRDGQYIITKVGSRPFYFGGDMRMLLFLAQNIRYPATAVQAGAQGITVLELEIDEKGQVTNSKVAKELGFGTDEEALRVIKLLPNEWVPAMVDGKPVKSLHYVPVRFSIK